ncbi:MAG: dTDP-4-dehydrorhamnose 3,5-epimerase family protein [bacterium]
MIEGAVVKELKAHCDERGRVMELVRNDDEFFTKFGQVYMTTNYPQVVKAWHCHKKQIDYVVCVSGMIKMVLFDDREKSPTYGKIEEYFIGEYNYSLIKIPCGVYHGWKCISEKESIVISTITEPYDAANPDEIRIPFNTKKIPYNWEIVFR